MIDPKRALRLARAAADALWRDNEEAWGGVAHQAARSYGLSIEEAEQIAADIRAALWRGFWAVVTARDPRAMAARIAQRAACRSAESLLPASQRAALLERRRAADRERKRNNGLSPVSGL